MRDSAVVSLVVGLAVALWAPAAIALQAPPSAQAADPALEARLEFAAAYTDRIALLRDSLVAPQWLPAGDRLIYWRELGAGAGTWFELDARTGEERPLIDPEALRQTLSDLTGEPVQPSNLDFRIAADGMAIAFPLGDRAFSLSLEGGRIAELATNDVEALRLNRDLSVSPTGQAVAEQRGPGFAVRTTDGRDLVARPGGGSETWRIPESAWSPDGRFLLVWRDDASGVHTIPVVDYESAIERVTATPYPKVGTPLVPVELDIVEPATGAIARVALPRSEGYARLAGWRPDGTEALVLLLSRDGKRLDLFGVRPATGEVRLILSERRPESFVGALDFVVDTWPFQVTPLSDNRRFLWMSERDGWRHAWLYDYDGTLERQVTSGAFPVHEVLGEGPDGSILVLASAEPDAPYDRLAYRADLTGGEIERLSTSGGLHRVTVSPSGDYYVDAHSARDQPRVREAASVDGRTRFPLTRADDSGWAAIHYAPPEAFTALAADGVTTLHGVLYKPWDFDPARRYPVIDYIHASPAMTIVPWNHIGNTQSLQASGLAQMGFIVMVLDARGTPGRSKAFQDANYGRLGQTEIPDHVGALRQAAVERPWMDMERVGVFGHSWGGYYALRAMLTAPEVFRAGYAAAPGSIEEEAVIMEPNMGLLSDNPEGYAAGSNLALAGDLRGTLRLMHGAQDVNASLSTTLRMAEALIRENKRFELLIMPSQGHSPRGAARRYYADDVHRFFVRTLGGPR